MWRVAGVYMGLLWLMFAVGGFLILESQNHYFVSVAGWSEGTAAILTGPDLLGLAWDALWRVAVAAIPMLLAMSTPAKAPHTEGGLYWRPRAAPSSVWVLALAVVAIPGVAGMLLSDPARGVTLLDYDRQGPPVVVACADVALAADPVRRPAEEVCSTVRTRNAWAFGGMGVAFVGFVGLAWRSRRRLRAESVVLDGEGAVIRGERWSRRLAWRDVVRVDTVTRMAGPLREVDLRFELIDGERVVVAADGSPLAHAVQVRDAARSALPRPDRETSALPPPSDLDQLLQWVEPTRLKTD